MRVDSLLLSHVWPSVEFGVNDKLYLREAESESGTAYHRILTLSTGTYSIGTLAVEIQKPLQANTHITDGIWTVTSRDGQLTLRQSSPTATARIFSRAEVRSQTSVPRRRTSSRTYWLEGARTPAS